MGRVLPFADDALIFIVDDDKSVGARNAADLMRIVLSQNDPRPGLRTDIDVRQ